MTSFLNALGRLIPENRLITNDAGKAAYESDGLTMFAVRPLGVVIAATQDEVIATVRLCHEHNVPFVARGSGTSLSGGAVPVEGGIVIALNQLNKILSLDPVQRICVVEAGTINLAVTKAASAHGLIFAPDPSSQQICTIGGNVAFNAGGAHCLKYGMTSNHVLGMKVVLANGDVVHMGGESLEGTGADFTGLFVGNEGLFGIALEMTLRLIPKVECYHTVMAGYRSLEEAGDAVSAIVASGILPGAMEIMDRLAMDAADAAVGAGYPVDAKAMLIVELEGPRLQVDVEKVQLAELLERSGAATVKVAKNEDERAKIWKGRKCAFSAVGRLSPDFIVQDGVVPRRKLGEALKEIESISLRHGVRTANVFHAGDGNLHPLIMFDGKEAGAHDRAEEAAAEMLRMCIRLGGSITGEHGVGMEKRAYLPEMFSADDLDIMHKIRAAFDPKTLSNPGKMFPSAEAPALMHSGLHPLEKAGVAFRD